MLENYLRQSKHSLLKKAKRLHTSILITFLRLFSNLNLCNSKVYDVRHNIGPIYAPLNTVNQSWKGYLTRTEYRTYILSLKLSESLIVGMLRSFLEPYMRPSRCEESTDKESYCLPIDLVCSTCHSDKKWLPLYNERNWQNNYYHWHVDFLPQLLHAIQCFGVDNVGILLANKPNEFQSKSLKLLGFSEHNNITIVSSDSIPLGKIKHICLERNRLLQSTPYDLIPYADISQLSSTLLRKLAPSVNSQGSDRLLIDRSDTTSRRILDHERIYNQLIDMDFRVIKLSEHSYAEQIRIFNNAKVVISPHGAGLTNIIFSRNCHVLEVFSRSHGIRADYWQLSRIGKCYYHSYTDPTKRPHNDVILPKSYLNHFLERTLC